MLIGKIMTNSKQRLMVTVENRKGINVIDLGHIRSSMTAN